MSNLMEHAKRELKLAKAGESMYGDMLPDGILKIVEIFAEEGHSGMSASITVTMLEKLLRFEPLTPLTGEDDEWNEVGEGEYQNNRCSHVFKGPEGAYDINGKVFREPSGACFTSNGSRVPVTFPYTPKTEYVDVPEAKSEPMSDSDFEELKNGLEGAGYEVVAGDEAVMALHGVKKPS